MYILEAILMICIICLCFLSTKSDLKKGIIPNKMLLMFVIFAIIGDSIYYGFFAQDLLIEFLINIGIVIIACIYLFYSDSIAGGDCKLIIVLSALYPARFYLDFENSNLTLIFAIGIAIFVGYCFLLINSVWALITKKNKLTFEYLKGYIYNFIKFYFIALVYISILNLLIILLYRMGIEISAWLSTFTCLLVVWSIGKFGALRNKKIVALALLFVIICSLYFKLLLISFRPESYAFILILILCQMTIRTNLYETISVEELKKGMILSTMSSILMQKSVTRGLPKVSTEDLKCRLTYDEAESVKIWARATHTDSITIVKKIPFAVFISVGFLAYFVLWRLLI